MKRHGFPRLWCAANIWRQNPSSKFLRQILGSLRLMGPRLAAPECEIIGVSRLAASRFLWLDQLVGRGLPLAIGNGLFLAVQTQAELEHHVDRRRPAHQGLDSA